jgi:hypothetical protein
MRPSFPSHQPPRERPPILLKPHRARNLAHRIRRWKLITIHSFRARITWPFGQADHTKLR